MPASTGREEGARRRSRIASAPQLLVALTFFTPTVRACNEIARPVSLAFEEPAIGAWFAPRYLLALLFAILSILLAARGSTPGKAHTGLVTACFAACALGDCVFAVWGLAHRSSDLLLYFVPFWPMAAIPLVIARRHEGWQRWQLLWSAHTALALGLVVPLLTALSEPREYSESTGLWHGGVTRTVHLPFAIGWGGFVLMGALALLVVLVFLPRKVAGPPPRAG
jgi:hypothetical protein